MRDLMELTRIVTKRKLKTVELMNLADVDAEGSKINELYNLLHDGQVENEDDAARILYSSDRQSFAYQKLRNTLRNRLINSLFVIDLKQASYKDRQKAYYECYRDLAALKILFGKQAQTAAINISRKVLKLARHFEFTELLIDVLQISRLYYGTTGGDLKKYQQCSQELAVQEQVWLNENRAESLYLDLSIGSLVGKETNRELQERAIRSFNLVKEMMNNIDTYRLQFYARLVEVSQFTTVNNYESSLDVCERAVLFFKNKPYQSTVPFQVFYYQKAVSLIQLRRFEEALEAINDGLEYSDEGSSNWFRIKQLLLVLFFHNGQYEEVFHTFQEVVKQPRLKEAPASIQETWVLLEGYLEFLRKTQLLKMPEERSFRWKKFQNEFKVLRKDKKGMNIHLYILEFLLNSFSDEQAKLIDRAEALDKYRLRYLSTPELVRVNYFLKMLVQIPKNTFNRELIEQKTAEDYAALLAVPIERANQPYIVEIVPYETLWKSLLKTL